MCYALKYGIWNVSQPSPQAVNALVAGGYSPLAAMVLSGRQVQDLPSAKEYLRCDCVLHDPFLMTGMRSAVERINKALQRREKIAVFGDYDVDGITSTCLLTHYLRSRGADCTPYIPGRLEEGYGLNPIAIHQLHQQGIKLIVTVDCGITALEEARLCKSLGIDLVITDHHECKDVLPLAVAVLDPHRPDGGYPHLNLSGVGVAFKLACALHGSQQAILDAYGDMLCLGTIADVMLLRGENRLFVERGLKILANTRRPGLAALMEQSGCDCHNLTASSVGYVLAPRINAAGRMGKIELAIDLFLTDDPEKAKETARQICELNKARQGVEADIYRQAVEMLPPGEPPQTIVLADESWHQGVVGIVASRMAEEYCCPTFLICLDGEHGKASSRSYGGFNLFAALKESAGLLESYGGHELAAGFTVQRQNIPAFREKITELARKYYADSIQQIVLDTDCVVTPELLTLSNVDSLSVLEPCGNGCPKPLLVMEGLQVEKISQVGSGKHMRLQLRKGHHALQAIYFSATPQSASIAVGDMVDVAFAPQVNEFRGIRSVQLNLQDIRPHCTVPCEWELGCYTALKEGTMTCKQAQILTPDRATLGLVWRYLSSRQGIIREEPMCLCRKIVRWSQKSLDLQTLLICLDIFADVGLLQLERLHKHLQISLCPDAPKADLLTSATMAKLLSLKES